MGQRTRVRGWLLAGFFGAGVLLGLPGCSGRDRTPPDPQPHPKLAPVDYGWIYRAFEGHPFLIVHSVHQQAHRLPGKANVELRLRTLQPEALVRHEIERLHRVHIQPDQRLQAISYFLRGLGQTDGDVLQADWGRGHTLHWTH